MNALNLTRDRIRERDRRALRRLAPMESREVLETTKISESLSIVKTRVQTEIWAYNPSPFWPQGKTWDVRQIKDAIADDKINHVLFRVAITPTWYEHLMQNGGIEEDHVAALKQEDLGRVAVGMVLPDESLMIIDGNHRIIRRYREGLRHVRVVIVPWQECKRFEIGERPHTILP